jgi:hypothetical protein
MQKKCDARCQARGHRPPSFRVRGERELASQRRRFGYRRLHILLIREASHESQEATPT